MIFARPFPAFPASQLPHSLHRVHTLPPHAHDPAPRSVQVRLRRETHRELTKATRQRESAGGRAGGA